MLRMVAHWHTMECKARMAAHLAYDGMQGLLEGMAHEGQGSCWLL